MKIEDTPIHILVSPAQNPRMSTLVFETLRVGFPKNPVFVTINSKPYVEGPEPLKAEEKPEYWAAIIQSFSPRVKHWDWIDDLIKRNETPFFICDTDMIFRQDCTEVFQDLSRYTLENRYAFIGEYVPSHQDIHTDLWMAAKYHASLLWINGPQLRPALLRDDGPACNTALSARPFICQHSGLLDYFDTLAHLQRIYGGLCIDGTGYWDHLHCGTWSQHLKGHFGEWLRSTHELVLAGSLDPAIIREKYKQYTQERKDMR